MKKSATFVAGIFFILGILAGFTACLDPVNFDLNMTINVTGDINTTDVTSAVILITNSSKTTDVTQVTISQEAETGQDTSLMSSVSFLNMPKRLNQKAKYVTPSDNRYKVDISYKFDAYKDTPKGEGSRILFLSLPVPREIEEIRIYRDSNGQVHVRWLNDGDKSPATPDSADTGVVSPDPLVGEGSSPAVIPPESRDKMSTFIVINRTRSQAVESVRFQQGSSVYIMGVVPFRDKQSIALGQGAWATTLTYTRSGYDKPFELPASPRPPLNSIVVPSNDPQSAQEHYLYFYLNNRGEYDMTEIWPPGDESIEDILPPDLGSGRGAIDITNNHRSARVESIRITNGRLPSAKLDIPFADFSPPGPVQPGQSGHIDVVGTDEFPIDAHDEYVIHVVVTGAANIVKSRVWIKDAVVAIEIPADAEEEEPVVVEGLPVIFNPNGGYWSDGSPATKTVSVISGNTVTPPSPSYSGATLGDWYIAPGVPFDLTTVITEDTGNIMLYAHWDFGADQVLTAVHDVEPYLLTRVGSQVKRIELTAGFDLGTMTNEESGWQRLLVAIDKARIFASNPQNFTIDTSEYTTEKYIDLDLSGCNMTGMNNVFNPVVGISDDAKALIVTLALPNGATNLEAGSTISYSTFTGFTELTSFSGAGLTTITTNTFSYLSSLKSFTADNVTYISSAAFAYCTSLAITQLPTALITASTSAFAYCSSLALEGTLPVNLETIGNNAFYDTSIKTITLPASLKTIGNSAFRNSANLALNGGLPASLRSIGYNAFDGTKIALSSLNEGLESIGDDAFKGCTLTMTTLPDSLTSVGNNVFQNVTSLSTINALPENLKEIGSYTFANIGFTLNALPAGLRTIGNYAFDDPNNEQNSNNLTGISSLPETLTSIGNYIFWGVTGLETVSLPHIRSIGNSAFRECTNLTQITLTSLSNQSDETRLTSISNLVFAGCSNLTVTIHANTPPLLPGTFNSPVGGEQGAFSSTSNITVQVPSGFLTAYENDERRVEGGSLVTVGWGTLKTAGVITITE